MFSMASKEVDLFLGGPGHFQNSAGEILFPDAENLLPLVPFLEDDCPVIPDLELAGPRRLLIWVHEAVGKLGGNVAVLGQKISGLFLRHALLRVADGKEA